mmetsp:Transcript_30188/g.54804  ORF Transcript_30188/g.54804 Transcript_30188/m.54804 type:complete len:303 (+) Transcript_30188:50-958(+)|eukprot:CAMPEP_0197656122 /NCGR_PEP_ID=MMETSP1338-20131121/40354_1 /TAXON_ID=43686 ORGANISM="Pelagodinium beii, Strain RCC1491" /NCGR_SAMPLE_ID=MMETSP1338 /ASSEMBLY_ACC=CAM_ASM_000754 /LENGTH=302 /DNA_ID=CAMNT_0043231959 /DNA_START=44 /DNA_END=952 /DNA_ORIENTATION=-
MVAIAIASDEMVAHALARQEQEHEDAELAKSLALAVGNEEDAVTARRLAASGFGLDPGLGSMQGTVPASNSMLYVSCEIGVHEVEMLVDTGAEMSVISEKLARQLGLLDRLDKSVTGMAQGVGKAKILGKLWDVPVKLSQVEFELSFSVLELERCEIILGLDLMRHFKCLVDLEKRCLIFGGSGGVEVPFLASARGSSVIAAALVQGHRAADLLRRRDPIAAPLALQTLGKLLQNVATQPMEPKYRRLRGSSERLQQQVLAHPEAVEILRIAGFIAEGDHMVLPAAAPLQALRQLSSASFLG